MLENFSAIEGFMLPAATAGAAACLAGLTAAVIHYRGRCRQWRDEHRNLSSLVENLSEGIYRSSLDGRQLSANRALVKLNGYETEAELLAAVKNIASEWYVDPKRRDEFREILQRDGYVEDFVSEIYRHKTRERIWITESARIVHHRRTGRPLYYEGSVREITETVTRLRLEEQFQKLTSNLPGGLFQIVRGRSFDITVNYLSDGFENLLEVPIEEITAGRQLFARFVNPDDRKAYFGAFRTSYDTMEPLDHEFRITTATGKEKWLRMSAKPERLNDGQVSWHGYVSDISLRKRQALEIEELAFYDPLTKLPNRRLLAERIARSAKTCRRTRKPGALFFIDLDNFKSLNDTQGHDIGDDYLVEISSRLRQCVRETDTVARMGGDEFVVILDGLGDSEAAAASQAIIAGNKMLSALRRPFERGELRHSSSASMGVVVFGEHDTAGDDLLKRADIAMYQAKGAGRDGLALFDERWMNGEQERFTLLEDFRRALEEKTLELQFQPQIDREGRVAGAEGLLRWRHPRLGMVPPDRFIALAEQAGLTHQLCRFVLASGVKTLAGWQQNPETAGLGLSLNVSVQSFSGPQFVSFLENLLEEHAIEASRLTIEFTEHVMATDQTLVANRMNALKSSGLRFSLDDFGIGYSSLARLKSLPFDEVKIDGSFVRDIENSDGDRALVRTILAMANTLGLDAVAEHVETRSQEAFLYAFGCDLFQGYLYAAAMPETAFLEFARAPETAASVDDALRAQA
ncbi:EAL domain-containing protein [Nitratireductor sp. StC3]|uniref:sensor domain-containing protein n=1 Tax=Nitratireductor sp. StC3 TaxID=2126741 RepID=UPI001304E99F|nr:EAL domain-containing protein [Nitratireductor sp. StC3]